MLGDGKRMRGWIVASLVASGCGGRADEPGGGSERGPGREAPVTGTGTGGVEGGAAGPAAPRPVPPRPVDALLDRLDEATLSSPLIDAEEVPVFVVDEADLPVTATMPGGATEVRVLPVAVGRLKGGVADEVEWIDAEGQRRGLLTVAPGTLRIPTYTLRPFQDCRRSRDANGNPRPLVEEDGDKLLEFTRFGARGHAICQLFPPSGSRDVEASDDPDLWPVVRATFGGNVLSEVQVKPRGRNVLDFSLPSTPGPCRIQLEFRNITDRSPLSMAVMLSDLTVEETDGRDRVLVPVDRAEPLRLRYRPRLPEAFQRLRKPHDADTMSVLLVPGKASVLSGKDLGFGVFLDGELVARGGPGMEAVFDVSRTRNADLEVRSVDDEAVDTFWLIQPTALFRRSLHGVRGQEDATVHPMRGHVMIEEESRRCLLAPPPTTAVLPIAFDPGDVLEFSLALIELDDHPLPQKPVTIELSLRKGEEQHTLFEVNTEQRDEWIDLVVDLERTARLEDSRLEIRTRRTDPEVVAGQRTLVAIAEPRVIRRKLSAGPNLLIYLIDTLRADHLTCYGYERPTSPRLDAFAADGILFERAYSPAPWTRPTIATLFSGMLYSFHGAGKTTGLSPSLRTIAERMRDAGYETAGFLANAHVHGSSLNFEQGFSRFVGVEKKRGSSRASEVNEEVFRWLETHGDRPFFLYVHTIDPHATYDPPPSTAGRFTSPRYNGPLTPKQTHARYLMEGDWQPRDIRYLVDLYDEEILFNDAEFGRLVDRLKEMDLYENTVIAVLSDHGEEFGEHDGFGHGNRLWEELLQVPLLLKLAGDERPRGVRVPDPVRVLDLLPTLAHSVGLPVQPHDFMGVDLAPWWGGGEVPLLDVIAEEEPQMWCLIRGHEKIMEQIPLGEDDLRLYYFDLAADPGERQDLAGARPELARQGKERYEEILRQYRQQGFHPLDDAAAQTLSSAVREALEELGYLDH